MDAVQFLCLVLVMFVTSSLSLDENVDITTTQETIQENGAVTATGIPAVGLHESNCERKTICQEICLNDHSGCQKFCFPGPKINCQSQLG